MRELHCSICGAPFICVTCQNGAVERLLCRFNVFPFRCQLCTNRFRVFSSGARHNTQAFDRRQYTRLTASIEAQILDGSQPDVTTRITDISMNGCTLQTTGLSKGAFVGLVLKPTVQEKTIHIETAMICSVRSSSMGIRFLEVPPEHQPRLVQVVLGLLVNQPSYLSSYG